jgi:hypothetical protein
VRSGYTRIGVIDGAVEESERLPLRELREALATPGVTVLGGASMGAVRAVQLESAGMQGVGRVFRLFRRGVLTDADEVYVLHAPATLHYRSLTLPLVNIRHTLRAMRLARRLSAAEERAIVSYMRDVPCALSGDSRDVRKPALRADHARVRRDVSRREAGGRAPRSLSPSLSCPLGKEAV